MIRRETHFGKLRRCISLKIRKIYDFNRRLFINDMERCKVDMKRCIENDRCMLEFGCIGLRTAFWLMLDVLTVISEVLTATALAFGILCFLMFWLATLIYHPIGTSSITAIFAIPFIVGCIYGCRMANSNEKSK